MDLTCQAIEKLANIANIEIKDTEKVAQELTSIIHWVEKLKEVDTTNIDVQHTMCEEQDRFGSTQAMSPLAIQKVFLNTRHQDGAYFQIPPVSTQATPEKPTEKH